MDPAGEPGSELPAQDRHRGPLKRAGLLERHALERQALDLAGPPARDHRAGDCGWVDADRRPGALGPGAQLAGQVGQEQQLVGLPVGMAGEQLIHRAAGRLGDRRVEERGRADHQHAAGLGLPRRRWWEQQPEVAVPDPARVEDLPPHTSRSSPSTLQCSSCRRGSPARGYLGTTVGRGWRSAVVATYAWRPRRPDGPGCASRTLLVRSDRRVGDGAGQGVLRQLHGRWACPSYAIRRPSSACCSTSWAGGSGGC